MKRRQLQLLFESKIMKLPYLTMALESSCRNMQYSCLMVRENTRYTARGAFYWLCSDHINWTFGVPFKIILISRETILISDFFSNCNENSRSVHFEFAPWHESHVEIFLAFQTKTNFLLQNFYRKNRKRNRANFSIVFRRFLTSCVGGNSTGWNL
jgi:hypothetical protein